MKRLRASFSSNATAGWASRLAVTAGGVLVRLAESEKPCPLASPQAWRRRWFVLRRGRLSGDRDVLEYYRSQRARKPIRAIDLSECAVWKHAGPGFLRKEFQNHFVFVVKTASRTFYLVAKTEEEMQVWVHSISQVCNLGHLDDIAGKSGRGAPEAKGGGGRCACAEELRKGPGGRAASHARCPRSVTGHFGGFRAAAWLCSRELQGAHAVKAKRGWGRLVRL